MLRFFTGHRDFNINRGVWRPIQSPIRGLLGPARDSVTVHGTEGHAQCRCAQLSKGLCRRPAASNDVLRQPSSLRLKIPQRFCLAQYEAPVQDVQPLWTESSWLPTLDARQVLHSCDQVLHHRKLGHFLPDSIVPARHGRILGDDLVESMRQTPRRHSILTERRVPCLSQRAVGASGTRTEFDTGLLSCWRSVQHRGTLLSRKRVAGGPIQQFASAA